MTNERWLTVADICERLNVHEETVRRWLRTGRLPGRAFGGRTGYRVKESDLQEFMSRDDREGKLAA